MRRKRDATRFGHYKHESRVRNAAAPPPIAPDNARAESSQPASDLRNNAWPVAFAEKHQPKPSGSPRAHG